MSPIKGASKIALVVVSEDDINGLNMFQTARAEFEPRSRLGTQLKH